jgi:predicted DNA-binding protein (MmcQ/YjbR family)
VLEWLRRYCLSFPHTTETIQWVEPSQTFLTIKCAPEKFADCVERPGITPAAYLARAKWISIDNEDSLTPAKLKDMIRESYELVWEKLPKKARTALLAQEK